MKLLLDTQAFIWWDSEPQRLSQNVLSLLLNPENELILSVVSLWEIQIKSQLGKVRLRLPLAELVKSQQEANNLSILPINPSHVYALDELKPFHKDPFDRMLIAQSKVENLRLVSNDEILKKYPIEIEW